MTETTKQPQRSTDDRDKETDESSHMGAEEESAKQTKPPTQELAELTKKRGQAPEDDYSPADEITPG